MNAEGSRKLELDLVAGLFTGFLLLLIALVVILGIQLGIRVNVEIPAGNHVGPFEALTFNFSEPVEASLAVQKFSIQPEVQGKFEWTDLKTLRFIPSEPYQINTSYTLSLSAGTLTKNGEALKTTRTWQFEVRQPLVVYVGVDHGKSRLLAMDQESGKTTPLTDDLFQLYDFDASRDGEFVVFSAHNEQQGIDLWRINRAGGKPILLLSCGPDRCTNPAISPDGRRIAYVREAIGPTPDAGYGAPRIRILDMQTKQDSLLYEDQQIIGFEPQWSPDGTRLSSYDSFKDEFRLLDLVTGNQLTIPSQTSGLATWSADSSMFVYTDLDTNEFGLHTRIREANITLNNIITLFGDKDDRDYYYDALAWSPTSDELVMSLRPDADNAQESLLLMSSATLDGQVIAEQPDHIYDHPIWDPWGQTLIFQQFRLKGTYKPEIGLWQPGMDLPQILAEGNMPRWLP